MSAGREALEVLIRRVDPDVPLPAYEHPGDAGADLRTTEACELAPGSGPFCPPGCLSRSRRGTRPSYTRDPALPPAAASPW